MNEKVHLLIHLCEAIGIAFLVLTTWRNSDMIESLMIWGRGIDEFISRIEIDNDEPSKSA